MSDLPTPAEKAFGLPPGSQAAIDAAYDRGKEAGVQAERERIEAGIGGLLGGAYMEGENAAWNRAVDAALAVVTGKEGASDEQ